MKTQKVKLITKHAEFPASKFPDGIIEAEYDKNKNVYYATNALGHRAVLFPEWLSPQHDVFYEETYQKAVKEARRVFDESCAKALEAYNNEKALAEQKEEEEAAAAEADKKAADQAKKNAKKKADEEKQKALAQEEADKNAAMADALKKASAIADAKAATVKQIKELEKKANQAQKDYDTALDKIEAFAADKSKQTPEFTAEHDALVTDLENKKTALENAGAELDRKNLELQSLSELATEKKK